MIFLVKNSGKATLSTQACFHPVLGVWCSSLSLGSLWRMFSENLSMWRKIVKFCLIKSYQPDMVKTRHFIFCDQMTQPEACNNSTDIWSVLVLLGLSSAFDTFLNWLKNPARRSGTVLSQGGGCVEPPPWHVEFFRGRFLVGPQLTTALIVD